MEMYAIVTVAPLPSSTNTQSGSYQCLGNGQARVAYERLLAQHTMDADKRGTPYSLIVNRTSPTAQWSISWKPVPG